MIREEAADLAARIRAGAIAPSQAVQASLKQIARWQTLTNAFSEVWGPEATRAARGADTKIESGAKLGPLFGVPIAVKDVFDVAGHPTTGCSEAYADNIAATDAVLVTALRDAGAILVGKTNMHELAMGGTNLVSSCGPTRNPFATDRITGGSSGGSAAALATGVVPLALGTDTGGSIRNPASMCGLFGLKPTQGRLSTDGVMALAPSLDCPGPMAYSARDLGLLWSVLAGSPEKSVRVSRVGLLGGYFADGMHPTVRAAVAATANALAETGIVVVEKNGTEGIQQINDAWRDFVRMEMVEAHPELAERRGRLAPATAEHVTAGLKLVEAGEQHALRRRPREARGWFERRFEGVDLLLAPSAPYPAPSALADEVPVGGGRSIDVHLGGTSRFTRVVNFSGAPALTIPTGVTDEGLPIGVQLIARWGAEDVLLTVARELEASFDRFRSPAPPG